MCGCWSLPTKSFDLPLTQCVNLNKTSERKRKSEHALTNKTEQEHEAFLLDSHLIFNMLLHSPRKNFLSSVVPDHKIVPQTTWYNSLGTALQKTWSPVRPRRLLVNTLQKSIYKIAARVASARRKYVFYYASQASEKVDPHISCKKVNNIMEHWKGT